jgi:hypothetical protein
MDRGHYHTTHIFFSLQIHHSDSGVGPTVATFHFVSAAFSNATIAAIVSPDLSGPPGCHSSELQVAISEDHSQTLTGSACSLPLQEQHHPT